MLRYKLDFGGDCVFNKSLQLSDIFRHNIKVIKIKDFPMFLDTCKPPNKLVIDTMSEVAFNLKVAALTTGHHLLELT